MEEKIKKPRKVGTIRVTQRRKKIVDYMLQPGVMVTPLKFDMENQTTYEELPEHMNLRDLVLETLERTNRSGSYYEYKTTAVTPRTLVRKETSNLRYRSWLDIWRHITSIRPEVSVFQVMETLYKLKDEIYGHYCPTVRRAVFCALSMRGWLTPIRERNFVARELRMIFRSWRNLTVGYNEEKEFSAVNEKRKKLPTY